MELTFLSHDNTAGEEIAKTLKSGKYSDFKVAVAYAKNSGITRIYNDLAYFANHGGKTSVVAGIDQTGTSYQALANLKTFAKDNLYIHHDRNFDITFHPKVYLFGNKEIEKAIIGSSNFTAGGFYNNYEASIGVTLDSSKSGKDFQKQVSDYWDNLLKDENTKPCDLSFLDKLLEHGSVVDERKQKLFKDIIEKISDLPFKTKKKVKALPPISTQAITNIPQLTERFAMTLSGFDVSSASQDPIILIPLAALKEKQWFWNFPTLYTDSGAGYPQHYAKANIRINGSTFNEYIRIYYYDKKKEFRLQCEPIKRNGSPGDIIVIHKDMNKPLEFEMELLRKGSSKFNAIRPLLTKKASTQKFFSYY